MITAIERFDAKLEIDPVTGCWLWQGAIDRDGYGSFRVDGRTVGAHRFAFEHARGPVPDGKVLDHVVCDRRACANPWHVEPRTIKQNTLRGDGYTARKARQTHCDRGHELTPENTRRRPDGHRLCRRCHREREQRRRAHARRNTR